MKMLIPLALTSCSLGALSATTLIYEGFNYGGADVNLLSSTLATNATGLSGNYSNGGNASGTDQADNALIYDASANLTFGSNFLPSTGGALYTSTFSTTNSSHALNASLSIGGNYTGKLYSSYLVNFTEINSSGVLTMRIEDSNGTNLRLQNAAQGATPATGYDSTRVTSTDGGSLQTGVTYLFVSTFTNVGIAGGGVATQYVFDQTGYNNWYNSMGDETTLGDFALWTATDSSTSIASMADGDIIDTTNFSSNSGGFNIHQRVALDEMRFGSTLGDVVGVNIPEPSTYALIFGGLAAMLLLRRRN